MSKEKKNSPAHLLRSFQKLSPKQQRIAACAILEKMIEKGQVVVFEPIPYAGCLDEAESVCINGDAIQINIPHP